MDPIQNSRGRAMVSIPRLSSQSLDSACLANRTGVYTSIANANAGKVRFKPSAPLMSQDSPPRQSRNRVIHGTDVFKNLLLTAIILLCTLPCFGKKKEHPPDPAWAGITARGRMLAEYHVAAWYAAAAVLAGHPAKGSINDYVAKKTDAGWVVAFGRLNDTRDNFLVAFLATQGATPQEFKAAQNLPPQEDRGFFYLAAKALEIAKKDFQRKNRPYKTAVLPAESGRMYVYIYPAQTTEGIYPLGGDVRYIISPDGSTIVEKRQLHKSILLFDSSGNAPKRKINAGIHAHTLSDVPEDTDVFYVLTRKPSIPEYIGAGKRIYIIQVDGRIELAK